MIGRSLRAQDNAEYFHLFAVALGDALKRTGDLLVYLRDTGTQTNP